MLSGIIIQRNLKYGKVLHKNINLKKIIVLGNENHGFFFFFLSIIMSNDRFSALARYDRSAP